MHPVLSIARGLLCFIFATASLLIFAKEAPFIELKGAQITAALNGKYVTDALTGDITTFPTSA